VRLHVLGSNGTYPSPGRPASGYAVEHSSTLIWMDAGPGTFAALWDRFDLGSVTAVIASHEHPDHCLDLIAGYHAMAFGPTGYPTIPVYCPQGVIDRIRGFVGAGDGGHVIDSVYEFRAVADGDRVEIGDISVLFRITDHSVPTVGCRLEAGERSLAYSADTGAAGDWQGIAEDVDLFLCEASYQGQAGDHPYAQHLTAGQAGSIAREQRAKRLMLTHIPPHLDTSVSVAEAESTFDRPVAAAVPGSDHQI
jgi:ribonuclease BN (tRNA processing enzyme)